MKSIYRLEVGLDYGLIGVSINFLLLLLQNTDTEIVDESKAFPPPATGHPPPPVDLSGDSHKCALYRQSVNYFLAQVFGVSGYLSPDNALTGDMS